MRGYLNDKRLLTLRVVIHRCQDAPKWIRNVDDGNPVYDASQYGILSKQGDSDLPYPPGYDRFGIASYPGDQQCFNCVKPIPQNLFPR